MATARPPLYVRILIAVGIGVALGILLGPRAARLGDLGLLIIRLLKALAAPLILFAVIDSFLRTHIPARRGLQLLLISAVNAAVATGLGLWTQPLLDLSRGFVSDFISHVFTHLDASTVALLVR